jgi:hypothetical protein
MRKRASGLILEGITADTTDARQLRRAQALLWLDDEESAEEINQRLGVSDELSITGRAGLRNGGSCL